MMKRLESFSNIFDDLKPTIIMILLQIGMAGVVIFIKLASNDGMHVRILIAYRYLFAAATVVPYALYFERNKRPKLTWMVIMQAFFCALFGGSMAQNLYAQSLVMTSATFASAIVNLIPSFTFIIAAFFGLERFELKSMGGKARVMGTLISLAGAMLLTFYKGTKIWGSQTNHFRENSISHGVNSSPLYHVLGPILAIISCLGVAIAYIFQAKMSAIYPCHYSSAALISVMGALQSVVYALCVERDWSQWKLGWNIRLLSAAYTGIVGAAIMNIITMWCVKKRGPLFVSVFSPLMLVIVAIAGSLFLNEVLRLGSVIGSIVIICGLYSVLWGKSEEMKRAANEKSVPSKDIAKNDDQKTITVQGHGKE